LLAAAGAAGGGTDTSTSARPPGPDCDAGGHGRDVDLAKKVLLDPAHIDAVKRESQGHVVHLKADGRPSDHVTEYRQEQDRVRNRIGDLKRIATDTRCSAEDKATAQQELSEASKLLDWTEKNVLPEK